MYIVYLSCMEKVKALLVRARGEKVTNESKRCCSRTRGRRKKIKSSLIILTTYVTEFFPHNFISCLTPFEHIESNLLRSKHRNSGCLMEYTGPTQTNRQNKVYAVDFLFSFARIPQSSIHYCVYVCMGFANIIN